MDKKSTMIDMINCIQDENVLDYLFVFVKKAYSVSWSLSNQEGFSSERPTTDCNT